MEVAATETVSEDAPDTGLPRKSAKRFLVPGLIAGLVIAFSLAGVFIALWLTTADTDPQEVTDFLLKEEPRVERTAAEVVTLLSNYDAANIDQVVDRMLQITTGSFREDYAETFEGGFRDAIVGASTSARGQILSGPDISFRGADEAVAVVRVSQTVQNDQNPGGQTFVDVMQITLIETSSGEWKADRVEILGGEET